MTRILSYYSRNDLFFCEVSTTGSKSQSRAGDVKIPKPHLVPLDLDALFKRSQPHLGVVGDGEVFLDGVVVAELGVAAIDKLTDAVVLPR